MRCLLVAAALAGLSARAYAGNPLDKPAFTATPQELLEAAKGATDDVTLVDELEVSFDDAGKATRRLHHIVAVTGPEGAAEWGDMQFDFRPWREDTPVIRSRVVSAAGDVHELDPSTLVDERDHIGETHHLRGRIPVTPGSVVEEQAMTVDRVVVPGGRGVVFPLAYALPTRTLRVTLSAPTALHATVVARALPKTAAVRHTTTGKRETWSYVLTNVPGHRRADDVPLDELARPEVAITLAHSWSDVAKAYSALVEPKLTMALPAELHAGDSLDVARAITSWVRTHVTYGGVNLTRAALDGANLDEAVKRGTGSINEIALLEAALLRAAGIKAELVLVVRRPHRGGYVDLPSLDDFDQVLVRATVRGADIWIDPADPDLPFGELRTDDQGRPALAIAHGVRFETPRAPASANTLHEVRTIELPELGAANVNETVVETGELARLQRGWQRKAGEASVRKTISDDVGRRYDGQLTSVASAPLADPDKALTTTIRIARAIAIDTGWDQIVVDVDPADVLEHLPRALRDPQATDRTAALELPVPFAAELTTRIRVPDGFVLPVAQPERKRALGALTLVETQHLDGRTLEVTHRIQVAKTRMTAAEANSTRKAILALVKAPEKVTIDHEAWALEKQGKYREVVAKMTARIAVRPGDPIDHARFAGLLLTLADGEGARREARKAVELAPDYAEAHLSLGWVLTHDLTGRQWGVGFDREGARKELELARSLAPDHAGAAAELAGVLERGTRGHLFGTGSDAKAAAVAWGAAFEIDRREEYGGGLLRALLWTGDYGGVEVVAGKMPASPLRDACVLAAHVMARGVDVALRDLPTVSERDKVVGEALSVLTALRRYDLAKELLAKAGASVPAAQQSFVQKLSRYDTKPGTDPQSVVFAFIGDQLEPGSAGAIYWDSETATDVRDSFRMMTRPPDSMMITIPVFVDAARSVAKFTVDGDAYAWRVSLESPGHKDTVYLAADHGAAKITGYPRSLRGLGRHVLRLLGKHDDAARRLLDWIASDLPRHDLRFVWNDALPKDTVHMTVAAALLAGEPDHDIEAGTTCGMTTVEGQNVCDHLAVRGLSAHAKYAELEAYATEWAARAAAAYVTDAIAERATALSALGRFDEADQVIDDGLAAHPDDARLLYVRIDVAALRGQRDEVARRADAAARQTQSAVSLNNIAWLEYVEQADLPGALAHARASFTMDSHNGFTANTLSALEAANGLPKDAVEHVRSSLELRHKDAPGDSDWYVLGQIYEDIGMRDDAIAAYRRISPPKSPELLPTAYSLATARLKTLGASKK